MSGSADVVAYSFKADLYCPRCVLIAVSPDSEGHQDSEAELGRLAQTAGIDRFDEHSFDSGDFPKVAFRDQLEPDDRCAGCGELLVDGVAAGRFSR